MFCACQGSEHLKARIAVRFVSNACCMRLPGFLCAVLVFGFGGSLQTRCAEAPPSAPPTTKAEETNAQDTLRSFIQLQEQLHATQMAIEQNRKDNAEAAARNAQLLTERLQGIEVALSAQRARELEAMQSFNRVMLIVAGTFALVGIGAMLLMAFFQWRTLHAWAQISGTFAAPRLLGTGSARGALTPGGIIAPPSGQVSESSSRLISALEQLEKRIYQLESTARPALREATSVAGVPGANGNGAPAQNPTAPVNGAGKPKSGDQERLEHLFQTGQSLLDQDKPEPALACFEEALTLRPGDAEALVKKGAALEQLQRPEEAIACYDEAIAADHSLTIAYLHKGGCLNRMERFTEALQCYEQALSTQEKRAA